MSRTKTLFYNQHDPYWVKRHMMFNVNIDEGPLDCIVCKELIAKVKAFSGHLWVFMSDTKERGILFNVDRYNIDNTNNTNNTNNNKNGLTNMAFIHHRCRRAYYTNYFHGVRITKENKCCPDCKTKLNPREFIVESRDIFTIRHKDCNANKCSVCEKVIGRDKSVSFKGFKLVKLTDNMNFIHFAPCTLNEAHRVCIYPDSAKFLHNFSRRTIMGADKSYLDLDLFWPEKCTRSTFKSFPREFRIMALYLLLLIKENHLRFPSDVLLHILNYAIQPKYYRIQNGFKLKYYSNAYDRENTSKIGRCRYCDERLNVCKRDVGCSSYKCSRYEYECKNGHLVPYGQNELYSCNNYRCYDDKCTRCKCDIAPSLLYSQYECMLEQCLIYEAINCRCGRKILKPNAEYLINECPNFEKIKAIHNSKDFKMEEVYCGFNQCKYVVKGKICRCGNNIFIKVSDDNKYCSLNNCIYASKSERYSNTYG